MNTRRLIAVLMVCIVFLHGSYGGEAGGNLLPGDTSFETGPGYWWFFRGDMSLQLPEVDRSCAVSGSSSLRVPSSKTAWLCSWSIPIRLQAQKAHVLSFFAKNAREKVPLKILIMNESWKTIASQEVILTKEWQRYRVVLPAQAKDTRIVMGWFCDSVYWLDCMQLQHGTIPGDYAQAQALVTRLSLADRDNLVVQSGQPTSLTLSAGNFGATSPIVTGKINLKILPYGDRTQAEEESFDISIPPDQVRSFSAFHGKVFPVGYYPYELSLCDGAGAILQRSRGAWGVVPSMQGEKQETWFSIMNDAVLPLQTIRKMGVRSVRVINHIYWERGEPQPNQWTLGYEEPVIDNYHQLGMTPHYVITVSGHLPEWQRGENGLPSSQEALANYLERLSAQYKGRVKYWEFENEPDLAYGQFATPPLTIDVGSQKYAAALRTAYTALKKSDPEVKVIGGNGSGESDGRLGKFTEVVLRDAGNALDVFTFHPYVGTRDIGPKGVSLPPEYGTTADKKANGLRQRLIKMAQRVKQSAPNSEFWLGELGWSVDNREPLHGSYNLEFARMLTRSYILGRSVPEVNRMVWMPVSCQRAFSGNEDYGLWQQDESGAFPRPAAIAYAVTRDMLEDARPIRPLLEQNVQAYLFADHNGAPLVAIWKWRGPEVNLFLPLSAHSIKTRDMFGGEIPPHKTTDQSVRYSITGSPLFLTFTTVSVEQAAQVVVNGIEYSCPFALHANAIDPLNINLSLSNLSNKEHKVKGQIIAPEQLAGYKPFSVRLRPEESLTIAQELPAPFLEAGAQFKYKLETAGGQEYPLSISLPGFTRIPRQNNPIMMDWDGTPPEKAIALVVCEQQSVLPPDVAFSWKGLEDLSSRAFLSHDGNNLHFWCAVIDNVHHQKEENARFYQGDSIQIAFDGENNASPDDPAGFGIDDREFGILLNSSGQFAILSTYPNIKSDGGAKLYAIRKNTTTYYHAVIPFASLSWDSYRSGRIFGFNYVVNDSDGRGRRFWMGLTPGIGESKSPVLFQKFSLE